MFVSVPQTTSKTRVGVYLPSPLGVCVAALPAWTAAVQPLAHMQSRRQRAAAPQRRAYGGPELTTLAASLWIWLPGYPSHSSDRCVGGVQSFLISNFSFNIGLFVSLWLDVRGEIRLWLDALCPVCPLSMTAEAWGEFLGISRCSMGEFGMLCCGGHPSPGAPIQLAPCLSPLGAVPPSQTSLCYLDCFDYGAFELKYSKDKDQRAMFCSFTSSGTTVLLKRSAD